MRVVEHAADIPGGTRFVQREVLTELLVPLARKVLVETETGFGQMHAALRDRATSRATGPVQP